MTKTIAFPETGFMRLNQVLQFIPICASTWWAWIEDGRAPKGVKLSHKVTVWRAEDIRALIERMGATT